MSSACDIIIMKNRQEVAEDQRSCHAVLKGFVNYMKQIGSRIKCLRMRAGMTQTELAGLLEVAPSTVGMYEQGRRCPDGTMLIKLCGIFSVSADSLLGVAPFSREASDIIKEMSDRFKHGGLLINGVPMSNEAKERMLDAVELATGIMLSKLTLCTSGLEQATTLE